MVYIHLGAEVSICSDEVIGIFDYKLSEFPLFQEYIDSARWENRIFVIEGETKSVVITLKKLYFTPVSRSTLARRCKKVSFQM